MSIKEKLDKPIDEIEVDDEMVLAAAKDINDTLKPNPLLDLEKPGEELQKDVEELFDNILEGDNLSDDTWKILKALGWKAAEAPKIEKPKASKPEKVAKEPKGSKVPGVVETIYLTIKDAGKKGVTKDDIAAVLKKAFPDRDVEKMKRTISAQVPTFMSKARGVKILSVDHRYYI